MKFLNLILSLFLTGIFALVLTLAVFLILLIFISWDIVALFVISLLFLLSLPIDLSPKHSFVILKERLSSLNEKYKKTYGNLTNNIRNSMKDFLKSLEN